MQKSLSDYKKNRKGEPVLTDEMKKQFFDTGASLMLYGSKKYVGNICYFENLPLTL